MKKTKTFILNRNIFLSGKEKIFDSNISLIILEYRGKPSFLFVKEEEGKLFEYGFYDSMQAANNGDNSKIWSAIYYLEDKGFKNLNDEIEKVESRYEDNNRYSSYLKKHPRGTLFGYLLKNKRYEEYNLLKFSRYLLSNLNKNNKNKNNQSREFVFYNALFNIFLDKKTKAFFKKNLSIEEELILELNKKYNFQEFYCLYYEKPKLIKNIDKSYCQKNKQENFYKI